MLTTGVIRYGRIVFITWRVTKHIEPYVEEVQAC